MKNVIIGVLLFLLIGAVIKIIWYPNVKMNSRDTPVTRAAKQAVEADVSNINKRLNKDGFEHAIHSDKENVVKETTILSDSAEIWKQRYLEVLGIKEKQAKLLATYETTIIGLKLSASRSDTGFYYRDKYALLEYIKPKDTIGSGHFNFKYNADVNYSEYWKRDWFLGRKKHYVDFWISDPRATINGVKRLKFEPKEDKVKVDINASSVYTDRLNIGVDGGVSVGRTRVGGGYYYDMVDKKWKPVITLKFKVLDL